MGSVALDVPSALKLDIRILVDRPKGSSAIAGWTGFTIVLLVGLGRITTSSLLSSDEWTPELSELARSGGDVELSVSVSERGGVNVPSPGIPESARRIRRGVTVDICNDKSEMSVGSSEYFKLNSLT